MSEAPDPEAIFIQALRAKTEVTSWVAQRINTKTDAVRPCIRVTLVGGGSPPAARTRHPTLQWEVWGGTEAEAARIAKAVDGVADELSGDYPAGKIVSSYHQGHYFHSPDAATGQQRYIGQTGLLTQ